MNLSQISQTLPVDCNWSGELANRHVHDNSLISKVPYALSITQLLCKCGSKYKILGLRKLTIN